jgi:hypothetical protein
MIARAICLAIALAAFAVAVFAVRPVATPGPFLRDFEAYWSAGVTANDGGDPYARAIWNAERSIPGVDATRDEMLPFVGPPQLLPLWRAFGMLGYRQAAVVWYAVLAIAAATLVALSLLGSGAGLRIVDVAAAVALALGFGPILSDLALGQIALLAAAGATAFPLALRISPRLAATCAFVAFAQPNLALGLTAQFGKRRAIFAAALAALACYAIGAIAAGADWPVRYGTMLVAHGNAERLAAIQLTPGAIAYGFGVAPSLATAASIAAALAALIAGIAIARRIGDPFVKGIAVATLLPFVSGFFHEHDLAIVFPAAYWCARRTAGATRSIATGGILLAGIDWLGLAQRPSGIAQSVLLAITIAAAVMATGDPQTRRATALGIAPVALLFIGAALAGIAHPAPIWPDALGAFHAAPADSVAAIWHDEQLHSGLLAQSAAWALLRALSLAGCGLLATAIILDSRRRTPLQTRLQSAHAP